MVLELLYLLTGSGTGATSTVTITNGTVTAVNVVEPGLGFYVAPTLNVVGSGTGASATAVIASKGNFETGETVISQGNTAKAVANRTLGSVTSITINDIGSKIYFSANSYH